MGSISGEEIFESDASQDAQEEKIFVAVRMRPLNDREIAKNDVSDWECINNTTIIFKNTTLHERALPTAYTFDRVFGCDSPTRQVYGEAAKKIALSVLSGMNSTIFAYGQTSSGKTFTMSGVTEYAVEDIYEYIRKHTGREFVLRFSAMEIYNELVRDLLSTEGIPLRLLDDPERGTVVDKLTEVTLTDLDHLKELLSVCEAQRQIGETSLNEVSSRSHQILRLTVESEAREFFGAENSSSLTASVNFVDLAGSERASQTSSAGTRLKEGCHINRSLLTLGTVIRKLSKGRNTHIPYRDSKLTRILQSSLGGNARTAIICTMSPAHTHVEQSRNTLLFASCAKQISTNAQVNVVMSEKALVKQLQRELARLENELKNVSSLSNSSGSSSTLREKELLIEKMEKQIQDLTNQRDLAHSRVQDMIRSGSSEIETPKSWNQTPKSWNQTPKSWIDTNHHNKSYSWSPSEASEIYDPFRSEGTSGTSNFSDRYGGIVTSRVDDQSETNEEQFLSDDTSPRQYIDKYFGPDPCKGWEKIAQQTNSNTNYEDNVKEVKCIEVDIAKRKNVAASEPYPHLQKERGDHLSVQSPGSPNNDTSDPSANVLRSNSCAAKLTTDLNSPSSEESQNTLEKETNGQAKLSRAETVPDREIQRRAFSLDSINSVYINVVGKHNITISQDSINSDYMDEEQNATKFIKDSTDSQKQACTKEPNEDEVTEAKSVKHDLDMEEEKKRVNTTEEIADTKQSGSDWAAEFERQRREIIKLWDACHIPLVHRTYFFLLFQGDPSDAVYMEVELRRLSFLKSTINGKAITFKDQQFGSQASRAKALHRERETLCKKMMKKFSEQDREALYERWDIDVSSKQRRLQLARKLWTNTTYMEHVKESAAIVAKLEGFQEPGKAPKEMFGLSFSPRPASFRSFSWRQSLPSIV